MKFDSANWNYSLLDDGVEDLVHLEIGPSPTNSPWLTMNLPEDDARRIAASLIYWADRLAAKRDAR